MGKYLSKMGGLGTEISGRFTDANQSGSGMQIKGLKNDPDDKWSNLHREREKNHMYKWIGPNATGQMVDAYDDDGDEGVLRFAAEKIEPLLYNDGVRPEFISENDFIKWRVNMSSNLGTDLANVPRFERHEAQWQLKKRGVEGETVVHLLLNQDQPKCAEICKILIVNYAGLVKDIYEGDEKYGQNLLHLAIVQDNYDMVSFLIDSGADVHQRATGRFFLPEDQKSKRKKKQTDYVGYAYYGEYPLALAACFGNKDIYDALIGAGANPNAPDTYGNTVSHLCVIHNSIEMYSYAVRHWAKPVSVTVTNLAGDTPLTLASTMGRKDIFEKMLELSKVEFWRFSDMTCSAYPLTALDSIRPDGSTDWDSALIKIINGSTADHLDIIDSEVVQRLLADKWKAFAARKLFERLALLVFHLACMCVAIYLRPTDGDELLGPTTAIAIVRYIAELCTITGCVSFLLQQQVSDLRRQGFKAYKRNLANAPTKGIFLLANILIILCVPCRLLGKQDLEEAFLCVALPCSWVFLLFFARGWLVTGPFVQMIYNMIAGDMVRFSTISAIFLVSFSQVFYFVGKDMSAKQDVGTCPVRGYKISTYENFLETFLSLFRMSMGGYDYEELQCAHYEGLTKVIFVMYMIVMPIMLINMLIAMMGNTYTAVISQAEKAWRQQWGQIVMVLEQSIHQSRLAKYQLEYSIQLAEAKRGALEVRGLMVIKQTKKTRARQRAQAIANWKRVGRKSMKVIKTHGLHKAQDLLHTNDKTFISSIKNHDITTQKGAQDLELALAINRRGSVMPTSEELASSSPATKKNSLSVYAHTLGLLSEHYTAEPSAEPQASKGFKEKDYLTVDFKEAADVLTLETNISKPDVPDSDTDLSPDLPGSVRRRKSPPKTVDVSTRLSGSSPLRDWKPSGQPTGQQTGQRTGQPTGMPNLPTPSVRFKVQSPPRRDVSVDIEPEERSS